MRTTIGGLAAGQTLPAQLPAAISQLTTALGALAKKGEAGASEAVADAALASRLAQQAQHGAGTHAALIASIIDTCARDICRVVGAEPA